MTDRLTAQTAKNMLLFTAQEVINSKDILTEADNKIADGDHGIGMALGMKQAMAALVSMESTADVYAVFYTVGKAMLMSMGGASGVIFGSMFMAGAKGMEPKAEISNEEFAILMEKGLLAIKERGKASVGDKTMVDALEPAVQAMKQSCSGSFAEMLDRAQLAAWEGADKSRCYIAKFGRAKSLGERAIGFQDAGAISVSIIFRAMHEFSMMP